MQYNSHYKMAKCKTYKEEDKLNEILQTKEILEASKLSKD